MTTRSRRGERPLERTAATVVLAAAAAAALTALGALVALAAASPATPLLMVAFAAESVVAGAASLVVAVARVRQAGGLRVWRWKRIPLPLRAAASLVLALGAVLLVQALVAPVTTARVVMWAVPSVVTAGVAASLLSTGLPGRDPDEGDEGEDSCEVSEPGRGRES